MFEGFKIIEDPHVPAGHFYFINDDYMLTSKPTKGGDSMVSRLTSRKFLLAVGAFFTFVANKQYTEAAAVISAYIATEGYIDSKNA